MLRGVLLVLVWLWLVHLAFGIREADVGKYDWVMQGLGRVSTVSNDVLCQPACDTMFVGSELGVVAALNTTSGRVIWRSVSSERHVVVELIVQASVVVAVMSRLSQHDGMPDGVTSVFVYSKWSGRLVWSSANFKCTYGSTCIMDFAAVLLPAMPGSHSAKTQDPRLAILAENRLQIVDVTPSSTARERLELSADTLADACGHNDLTVDDLLLHRLLTVEDKLVILGTTSFGNQTRSLTSSLVDLVLIALDVHKVSQDTLRCRILRSKEGIRFPRNFLPSFSALSPVRSPLSVSSDLTSAVVMDHERRGAFFVDLNDHIAYVLTQPGSTTTTSVGVQHIDLLPYISRKKTELLAKDTSEAHFRDVEAAHVTLEIWAGTALPSHGALLTNGHESLFVGLNGTLQAQREGRWISSGHGALSVSWDGHLWIDMPTSGLQKYHTPDIQARGQLVTASVQKTDTTRIVMSFDDMSLVCVHLRRDSATVQWIREEALSSIMEVTWFANEVERQRGTVVPPTLISTLQSFRKLKETLWRPLKKAVSQWLDPQDTKRLSKPRLVEPLLQHQKAVVSGIERDSSVLIVLTCSGRSFALDSRTGRIVWATAMQRPSLFSGSNYVTSPNARCHGPILEGNFAVGQGFLASGRTMMFQLPRGELAKSEKSNSLHSPINNENTHGLRSPSSKPRIFLARGRDLVYVAVMHAPLNRLQLKDLRTGKTVHDFQLPNETSVITTKVVEGEDVLVDATSPCRFCRTLQGKTCVMKPDFFPLRTFAVRENTLQGQLSMLNCSQDVLWSMDFGLSGHVIAAAATPVPEKHSLPVHVRGDGTVLFKFNTENTVVILLHSQKDLAAPMTLLLLDTETGEVLLSFTLPKGAALPANLLIKEHRIIIHYWNKDASRFEILSLEVYYDKPDTGPWKLVFDNFWRGSAPSNNTLDDFHHTVSPLKIFSRAFIFAPGGVRAMAFTQTSLSITPQSLLLVLSSGQLYALNHRVISPRRPYPLALQHPKEVAKDKKKVKTAEEMEELLPPYHPIIPLVPTGVLSYYHELAHQRGIFSKETSLESTSIVFAFGLDLFSTAFRPADSAFDIAGDLYNPPLLFAILLVAFSVVAFTRKLAKEKEIAIKWA